MSISYDEVPVEAIRRLRESMHVTQKQLARTLGVEPNTVTRWEMGLHQPRGRHRQKLLRLLGRLARVEKRNGAV